MPYSNRLVKLYPSVKWLTSSPLDKLPAELKDDQILNKVITDYLLKEMERIDVTKESIEELLKGCVSRGKKIPAKYACYFYWLVDYVKIRNKGILTSTATVKLIQELLDSVQSNSGVLLSTLESTLLKEIREKRAKLENVGTFVLNDATLFNASELQQLQSVDNNVTFNGAGMAPYYMLKLSFLLFYFVSQQAKRTPSPLALVPQGPSNPTLPKLQLPTVPLRDLSVLLAHHELNTVFLCSFRNFYRLYYVVKFDRTHLCTSGLVVEKKSNKLKLSVDPAHSFDNLEDLLKRLSEQVSATAGKTIQLKLFEDTGYDLNEIKRKPMKQDLLLKSKTKEQRQYLDPPSPDYDSFMMYETYFNVNHHYHTKKAIEQYMLNIYKSYVKQALENKETKVVLVPMWTMYLDGGWNRDASLNIFTDNANVCVFSPKGASKEVSIAMGGEFEEVNPGTVLDLVGVDEDTLLSSINLDLFETSNYKIFETYYKTFLKCKDTVHVKSDQLIDLSAYNDRQCSMKEEGGTANCLSLGVWLQSCHGARPIAEILRSFTYFKLENEPSPLYQTLEYTGQLPVYVNENDMFEWMDVLGYMASQDAANSFKKYVVNINTIEKKAHIYLLKKASTYAKDPHAFYVYVLHCDVTYTLDNTALDPPPPASWYIENAFFQLKTLELYKKMSNSRRAVYLLAKPIVQHYLYETLMDNNGPQKSDQYLLLKNMEGVPVEQLDQAISKVDDTVLFKLHQKLAPIQLKSLFSWNKTILNPSLQEKVKQLMANSMKLKSLMINFDVDAIPFDRNYIHAFQKEYVQQLFSAS